MKTSTFTVDLDRRCKVTAVLVNAEGEEFSVEDKTQDILDLIEKRLQPDDKDNILRSRVLPVMNHALTPVLNSLLGTQEIQVILADEQMKQLILRLLLTGFYLLKTIQVQNLLIRVDEEEMSDEQLEASRSISTANEIIVKMTMAGYDPVEIAKALVKSGVIKQKDLDDTFGDENDEEDE